MEDGRYRLNDEHRYRELFDSERDNIDVVHVLEVNEDTLEVDEVDNKRALGNERTVDRNPFERLVEHGVLEYAPV